MTLLVDEGDLVLIGSVALNADADRLLTQCDIAALVRVVARVEGAASPLDKAATVLVEVVAQRPFPDNNAAVGWLAAAHVLGASGLRLRLTDRDAHALIAGVAGGSMAVAAVAEALSDGAYDRHRSLARRLFRAPRRPSDEAARTRACPLCGRRLRVAAAERLVPAGRAPHARFELSARCWAQHRAHDHRGRPVSAAPRDDHREWSPVVAGPLSERGPTFLALVSDGAVLFRPAGGRDLTYRLSLLRDVEVSDLVGDWAGLDGEPLGDVGGESVRFDHLGRLNWDHLVARGDPLARASRDRRDHTVGA